MKTKLIALAAFTIFSFQFSTFNTVKAQRPEMTEQRAEKLAKDFDLKDDAKDKFLTTYKAYQDELRGLQRGRRTMSARNDDADKKKLTDEEATQRVEEYFARQEEMIAQQQKRLDIEKKYYAELKQVLTPQQLTKIFRQHNMQRNMPSRQGGPQRQGGFGGPREGGRGGFGGGSQGGDMGGDF